MIERSISHSTGALSSVYTGPPASPGARSAAVRASTGRTSGGTEGSAASTRAGDGATSLAISSVFSRVMGSRATCANAVRRPAVSICSSRSESSDGRR